MLFLNAVRVEKLTVDGSAFQTLATLSLWLNSGLLVGLHMDGVWYCQLYIRHAHRDYQREACALSSPPNEALYDYSVVINWRRKPRCQAGGVTTGYYIIGQPSLRFSACNLHITAVACCWCWHWWWRRWWWLGKMRKIKDCTQLQLSATMYIKASLLLAVRMPQRMDFFRLSFVSSWNRTRNKQQQNTQLSLASIGCK